MILLASAYAVFLFCVLAWEMREVQRERQQRRFAELVWGKR